MHTATNGREKPAALALLAAQRPRNVGWLQAAGLLFGDWGTSRLYVLGLAFLFAGRTSFYLIVAMSLLIMAVGWAYTQICRIYPDGGGVYTAAKSRSRTLAVIGALLLFADYTGRRKRGRKWLCLNPRQFGACSVARCCSRE